MDSFHLQLSSIALFLAPCITIAMLYRDISRARQWLGLALLPMQVLRPLTMAALATLLWWFSGHILSGSIALWLAGLSVLFVVLPQAVVYHLRQRKLVSETNLTETQGDFQPQELFNTALPIFVTRCASLTMQYSNVLLVGFLAGPAAAGAYFAAERLAQLASVPATVVSSVNQQAMAAAHATGDFTKLQTFTAQSAHGSLWPTLAIALGLVIFATPLLGLFGNDFAAARSVLIVLVLANVVSVFLGPAQGLLVMTGRERMIPRVVLYSAAIHVLALCFLVPPLGAFGAALATTTSTLVSTAWLMVVAKRETGIGTTVLGQRARPLNDS